MEIVLKRIAKKNDYTIGRLYMLADGDVKHKVIITMPATRMKTPRAASWWARTE